MSVFYLPPSPRDKPSVEYKYKAQPQPSTKRTMGYLESYNPDPSKICHDTHDLTRTANALKNPTAFFANTFFVVRLAITCFFSFGSTMSPAGSICTDDKQRNALNWNAQWQQHLGKVHFGMAPADISGPSCGNISNIFFLTFEFFVKGILCSSPLADWTIWRLSFSPGKHPSIY